MIQCRSIGQITRTGLVSPCRRDCPRLLKSMQFIYMVEWKTWESNDGNNSPWNLFNPHSWILGQRQISAVLGWHDKGHSPLPLIWKPEQMWRKKSNSELRVKDSCGCDIWACDGGIELQNHLFGHHRLGLASNYRRSHFHFLLHRVLNPTKSAE